MAQHRSIEVYDTPSGLGGSFTVSIVREAGERVTVRVWYGRASASSGRHGRIGTATRSKRRATDSGAGA